MLTIIHGDDISKSRNFFLSIKSNYTDSITLDGRDLDITNLTQILEGGSLFSDEKILFIENLSVKKKNQSEYKALIEFITNLPTSTSITIWENKILDKKYLNDLKSKDVRLFKLPTTLFTFLESLKPGSGHTSIKHFHTALPNTDPEALFYLLIRHIRLMIVLHPDSKSQFRNTLTGVQNEGNKQESISELRQLQDWQANKIKNQSKFFSLSKLLSFLDTLFEIDLALKTGKLPGSLSAAIDIFLLSM